MAPPSPVAEIARQALADLEAVLHRQQDGRRLDLELALLTLAGHGGPAAEPWGRLRARTDAERAALERRREALAVAARGLRGVRGLLRHGPRRGAAWRAWHRAERERRRRAETLAALTALLTILEGRHPSLRARS